MRYQRLGLPFYGIGVFVESEAPEVLAAIERDFSYFLSLINSCHLRIECRNEKPDYEGLPVLLASSATPRNICFTGEHETYIDYFVNALNIYNKRENICRIITDDVDMARAIAYLTILSWVSELLDQHGTIASTPSVSSTTSEASWSCFPLVEERPLWLCPS